jgi:hypothetical protein
MAMLLRYHWYAMLTPLAAALKVAAVPALTEMLEGWVAIVGAARVASTVMVAALLVTVPAALLTTTV